MDVVYGGGGETRVPERTGLYGAVSGDGDKAGAGDHFLPRHRHGFAAKYELRARNVDSGLAHGEREAHRRARHGKGVRCSAGGKTRREPPRERQRIEDGRHQGSRQRSAGKPAHAADRSFCEPIPRMEPAPGRVDGREPRPRRGRRKRCTSEGGTSHPRLGPPRLPSPSRDHPSPRGGAASSRRNPGRRASRNARASPYRGCRSNVRAHDAMPADCARGPGGHRTTGCREPPVSAP